MKHETHCAAARILSNDVWLRGCNARSTLPVAAAHFHRHASLNQLLRRRHSLWSDPVQPARLTSVQQASLCGRRRLVSMSRAGTLTAPPETNMVGGVGCHLKALHGCKCCRFPSKQNKKQKKSFWKVCCCSCSRGSFRPALRSSTREHPHKEQRLFFASRTAAVQTLSTCRCWNVGGVATVCTELFSSIVCASCSGPAGTVICSREGPSVSQCCSPPLVPV